MIRNHASGTDSWSIPLGAQIGSEAEGGQGGALPRSVGSSANEGEIAYNDNHVNGMSFTFIIFHYTNTMGKYYVSTNTMIQKKTTSFKLIIKTT